MFLGAFANDKRLSSRKELPIRAILTLSGTTPMTVRTMDVGKHGVSLIGIAQKLSAGQNVSVALEMFFNGKIRNVKAHARVSHCVDTVSDGFKVGLQFVDLDSHGAALLAQFIAH